MHLPAAKSNHIRFGDCHVSEPRNLTFTLTNHSKADCVRFQWPEDPVLKFSPHVGHLHAGCAKDMSVTFQSTAPKTLTEHVVPCKIIKIAFDQPVNQVSGLIGQWTHLYYSSTVEHTYDACPKYSELGSFRIVAYLYVSDGSYR